MTPTIVLGALVAITALVWAHLAPADAPFVYHADEPLIVLRALRMLADGQFNPGWFRYPPLPIYIQAALYVPVQLATGAPLLGTDLPEHCQGVPPAAFPYVHTGRFIALGCGLATIVQTARLIRLVASAWAAVGGALLFATSSLVAQSATTVTVDMPMTLFAITAIYYALRMVGHGDAPAITTDARRFTIAATLAACMKYNAAVVLLLLPIALAVAGGGRRSVARETALNAALAVGLFLVATPFAVLDPGRFWDPWIGMPYNAIHYARGHLGFDRGSALLKSAMTLWVDFGPLTLLAPLALVRVVTGGHRARHLLLVAAIAILWLPVAVATVYFPRNVVALAPLACALVIIGAEVIGAPARRALIACRVPRSLAAAMLAVAMGAVLVDRGIDEVRTAIRTAGLRDTRTLAYDWLARQLPAGHRVIAEWYTPQLHFDPRFRVRCIQYLARTPLAVLAADFDVALVSSAMTTRFPTRTNTTYAQLGPDRLLQRWHPDDAAGTKGPTVELFRLRPEAITP
jgi:hypothetical protein